MRRILRILDLPFDKFKGEGKEERERERHRRDVSFNQFPAEPIA